MRYYVFLPERNSYTFNAFVVKHLISKTGPKVKLGHTTPQKSKQYIRKWHHPKSPSVLTQVELLLPWEEISVCGSLALFLSIRRFDQKKGRVIYNLSEGYFCDYTRQKRCRKSRYLLETLV